MIFLRDSFFCVCGCGWERWEQWDIWEVFVDRYKPSAACWVIGLCLFILMCLFARPKVWKDDYMARHGRISKDVGLYCTYCLLI